jgi:hypothetical protein
MRLSRFMKWFLQNHIRVEFIAPDQTPLGVVEYVPVSGAEPPPPPAPLVRSILRLAAVAVVVLLISILAGWQIVDWAATAATTLA